MGNCDNSNFWRFSDTKRVDVAILSALIDMWEKFASRSPHFYLSIPDAEANTLAQKCAKVAADERGRAPVMEQRHFTFLLQSC